jgi:DNA-binding NarL/FixJ family response regulator
LWQGGFVGVADWQAADVVADVLLLDLQLAQESGLDWLKVFRKQTTGPEVVVLSSIDQPAIISTALKLGAKSYLLKNARAEDLFEAIRQAAAGEVFLPDEIRKLLLDQAVGNKTSKSSHALLPKLTTREREILRLIADELTTTEIAKALFLSENTIETHRNNLMMKLEVRNVAGLVRKAMELGLL